MIDLSYKPVKQKYCDYAVAYSDSTYQLIKRKHILERFGGSLDEWRDLADEFLADGGRANHAYCMAEYRKRGGVVEPVAFEYVPPEPEVPETNPLCPECLCELHLTTAGYHVCRNEACKLCWTHRDPV